MLQLSQDIQMWVVIVTIVALIVGLVTDKIRPHFLFLGSCVFLMVVGIMEPQAFLHSFANKSIATIFILILLTAGLTQNFNILKFLDRFFIQKQKPKLFVFQMTSLVALMSSVMNNTPIVALMIPYVLRWSKRMQVSPSKLMIPLSFAAVSGGMITVIGTSTNLVLNGFIESNGETPLNFSHYLVPGLLVAGVTVLFLTLIGINIIKERKSPTEKLSHNLKEYLVEMALDENSPKIGKTIQEAGLRNLQGVYLFEILRDGQIISPVAPDEILQQKDRLYFAGDTQDIVEIIKDKSGFRFPKIEAFNLEGDLELIETLIPYNSYLANKTLKESAFREKYDAAVVAIHRNGERLRGKLGDIKLEYGDLLLLTAGKTFRKKSINDKDLYVISTKDQLGEVSSWKSKVLLISAAFILVGVLTSVISFFVGLLLMLSIFFGLKLMGESGLKKNLNLDLFLILGSSIALGSVFIETDGAKLVSNEIIHIFKPFGTISIIFGIYILTLLLTSFITNAAAIAIVFPIVFEMGHSLNVPVEALYLVIAFGASCCFLTPYSYQTNLMIYGPGGYKFSDFFKIGLPMAIIYTFVALGWIFYNYQII